MPGKLKLTSPYPFYLPLMIINLRTMTSILSTCCVYWYEKGNAGVVHISVINQISELRDTKATIYVNELNPAFI